MNEQEYLERTEALKARLYRTALLYLGSESAALDAVDPEPLPADSPLWDMENVILTPHCAADSTLYMDRAMAQFCDNLARYEKGEPLFNEIDLQRRY